MRASKPGFKYIDEPRLQRIVINEITRLKTRRAAQMRDIAKRPHTYANFAKRLDLVLSIPGTGERPPLALFLRMPEPGRVSSEEAAALVGLALVRRQELTHESNLHRRRQMTLVQVPVRSSASSGLPPSYARLRRRQTHKSALIARARMLLIYADTVVQSGTPWTETAALL